MQRRLAAIVVADYVGFSRMVAEDETGTIERMRDLRDTVTEPAIQKAGGRIVKRIGDGTLVEFASVLSAVEGAIAVQQQLAEIAKGDPEDRRFVLRIGVHLGEVLIEKNGDIHGDGVNVAARLEGLCAPGEILLSGAAWEQVEGRLNIGHETLGPRELKNIPRQIVLHRLIPVENKLANPASEPGKMALPLPRKPSIVVLPFQNMSSDAEQDFFCDGLVEDLITALSRFNSLFVIARNTSFTYRDRAVNVREVSRELGVQYVLEGSVRRAGQRMRVTAQLIDAIADRHVWADQWDRPVEDAFEVQDELTRSIAMCIAPQIQSQERGRVQEGTVENLSSRETIAKAHWHLDRFTATDNRSALQLLDNVLRSQPNNEDALCAMSLAKIYDRLYWGGEPDDPPFFEAVTCAEKAIAIEPESDDARTQMGLALWFQRRHAEAKLHLEHAISLNANNSTAIGVLGRVCVWTHDFDQAEDLLQRALRLSPRDPWSGFYQNHLSIMELLRNSYDKAIWHGNEALRRMPQAASPLIYLAATHALAGDQAIATTFARRALDIMPELSCASIRANMPFYYEKDIDLICRGLSAAGVPD